MQGSGITVVIAYLRIKMQGEDTKFIRLRLNTLLLAAGMKGEVNRAEAQLSVGGLKLRRNSALIPRSWLRGASY